MTKPKLPKKSRPFAHQRIFLIPLDSRPVCYDLPRRLAASAGLTLGLPSPKLLGQLKQAADEQALLRWVKNHLFENEPLIVALDTIAYGGLIPSRVTPLAQEPLETVEARLSGFYDKIKAESVLGFSSILRIPHYNNAEEEPDYWAEYGERLYQYSVAAHEHPDDVAPIARQIPETVVKDFLARRERNFEINQEHLKRLVRGDLDYLTYCQDDTGAYGLNVQEAQALTALIEKKKCQSKSHVQTGADEVAACLIARLLSRWHADAGHVRPRIFPIYSHPEGDRIVAKFDGISIGRIVTRAIQTCGAQLAASAQEADLTLLVHTPAVTQGDHCELPWSRPVAAGSGPADSAQYDTLISHLSEKLTNRQPVALADVAYANGSDPHLTNRMLQAFEHLDGLYGYAGWNTPGNTIGTAISMAVVRWIAERHETFNQDAFAKLMLIRLGDDWLYQSRVRKLLRQTLKQQATPNNLPDSTTETLLNIEMANGLSLIKTRLDLTRVGTHCRFPCGRTFEVEISV